MWMRKCERERERPFLQIGFHRLGMKPVQLKEIEAISFFLKMRDMKEMEPCWTNITKHSHTHSACEAPILDSLLFPWTKESLKQEIKREEQKRRMPKGSSDILLEFFFNYLIGKPNITACVSFVWVRGTQILLVVCVRWREWAWKCERVTKLNTSLRIR